MSNLYIKQGYFGISVFIVFNILAMIEYPGGTIIDSTTEGYLFFYNFFSNLGEWTAKNGELNTISAYLFNFSLIVLSISYFIFYYAFLKIQVANNKNKLLNFLSISTIFLSLIFFVLVALFSSDPETFDSHVLFVKVAFRSLLIHCILQSIVVYLNNDFGKSMLISSILFTIVLFLFILVMEFGPNPFKDNESLFIQVLAQKVIVTSILIYFFFQIRETISIQE